MLIFLFKGNDWLLVFQSYKFEKEISCKVLRIISNEVQTAFTDST